MEKDALNSLIKGVVALPSLPAIAVRIIQEVKRDRSSLSELASIISFDPALTAKILRIANSSFYALPNKVKSIERAVNILGLEALKNIALSFIIVKGFRRNSVDEFDHELFWKRSITAAVSASMIASKLEIKREDAFVTPLLMDIGVLAMYLNRPDDYLRVLDEKKVVRVSTIQAEQAVFGFDHQDVGAEILKAWGIPENIYMPIAYHHRIERCPPGLEDIVSILMLADLSSSVYHGNKSVEKMRELKSLLQEKLDMSGDEVDEFVDAIADKTVEILDTFEIDAGNMKPYSQILEEANEELGKMNLSYEQLVMELKQEKDKVESLARDLKSANDKLRELAFRDGLTNLYNHRFLQEVLDKEIHRIKRYPHPLSFMLIDIDHFKKVNDTYGHRQGDVVLRCIAEVFEQTIRKSDTAARYGGEEFAVVLPETNLKSAVIIAERLRQLIEKLEIKADDQIIKVTISIGITTCDPSRGLKSKEEIIDAADRALYQSKQSGRNRVSVVV